MIDGVMNIWKGWSAQQESRGEGSSFEGLPKNTTQLYAALNPGSKVRHVRSPRLTTPSHSIRQSWLSGDPSEIYYWVFLINTWGLDLQSLDRWGMETWEMGNPSWPTYLSPLSPLLMSARVRVSNTIDILATTRFMSPSRTCLWNFRLEDAVVCSLFLLV